LREARQVGRELARVGVAVLGLLLQALEDHGVELGRDAGLDLAGGSRRIADDAPQELDQRVADEGGLPGQGLEQDRPQGVDVGPGVDGAGGAGGRLGGHVVGRPQELAAPRQAIPLVAQVAREAEIRQVGTSLAIDQNVGGLDVPVEDPLGVGVSHGLGDRR